MFVCDFNTFQQDALTAQSPPCLPEWPCPKVLRQAYTIDNIGNFDVESCDEDGHPRPFVVNPRTGQFYWRAICSPTCAGINQHPLAARGADCQYLSGWNPTFRAKAFTEQECRLNQSIFSTWHDAKVPESVFPDCEAVHAGTRTELLYEY